MGKKPTKEQIEQSKGAVPKIVEAPGLPTTFDVEAFVERMMATPQDVTLPDCFRAAADFAAYMTAVRNKGMVLGSRYIPESVIKIGEQASKGDLDAAKVLFDFLGFRAKTPIAQVNTAINVSVPTLRDIIDVDSVVVTNVTG